MKLCRDEVLMVPYKCCCFSAISPQGRIQGGAKIGQGGPLLQETSSDRKATATNRMHSSDLEAFWKKCCYTPRNEVRKGYTGITPSVRLSVRLSVDAHAVR